jgi:hypothetical protein
MDEDLADLEGAIEPHVGPGFAAVGRLVHAVAIRGAIAGVGFPGADPNDIGIGLADRDIADGNGRLVIELVGEGGAVVRGPGRPCWLGRCSAT